MSELLTKAIVAMQIMRLSTLDAGELTTEIALVINQSEVVNDANKRGKLDDFMLLDLDNALGRLRTLLERLDNEY